MQRVISRHLEVSRGFLRRLRRHGQVLVDGMQQRLCDPVQAGQQVCLLLEGDATEDNSGVAPEALPLNVVYEDNHILVVNKPAQMVVHPARRHTGSTLVNAVAYHLAPDRSQVHVRPVHRLDACTSGLIVFALHAHANYVLSKAMAEGTFRRRYLAIVAGYLPVEDSWQEIRAPIARVPGHPVKRMVASIGQTAATRYRVVQSRCDASLLELELLTGRTHQVRVHMAYIGYPLVGDELYAGPPSLDRAALHSAHIALLHPLTHEPMEFIADLPPDMRSYWYQTHRPEAN